MATQVEYEVITMTEEHIAQVSEVIATAFMREPMTRTLNLSYQQVLTDFSKPVEKLASLGYSVVAVEKQTGKVIGACINKDYTIEPVEEDNGYSDSMPIFALVDELDELAIEIKDAARNDVFHLYILAVNENYCNQGIGHALSEATYQVARQNGFKRICSEVTGPISQHITLNKVGFKEIARVNYHDFSYNGVRVFDSIPNSEVEGCLMVLANLTSPQLNS